MSQYVNDVLLLLFLESESPSTSPQASRRTGRDQCCPLGGTSGHVLGPGLAFSLETKVNKKKTHSNIFLHFWHLSLFCKNYNIHVFVLINPVKTMTLYFFTDSKSTTVFTRTPISQLFIHKGNPYFCTRLLYSVPLFVTRTFPSVPAPWRVTMLFDFSFWSIDCRTDVEEPPPLKLY